ncbi:MAG: HD domain-containing protein, partial [Promethearchaeota archaeon]
IRDHFHASYKGGKGKDEISSEIHLTRNEDIINRFKQIKKEAVIRPVIGESKIHNSLEKASSYKNLESTYQLGLKNVLLDEREKTLHTRKAHSLGVRNIGLVWLKALSPYINSTVFNNLNWEKIIECLETALLLHDISHLPFSHMSEEIFGDLNWIILKEGAEHRHDEWQIEQLPNIEQEEIKKAIKESLKLSDQEFTSYYNFIQDLMAGVSGIPFLDAIMNSPLDADKIDYIYRDMEHAGRTTRLPKTIKDWLEPFLSHTSLTPEGLVRLNNEAAQCTLNLLRERQFLYESLYLLPEVRAFESIASTIIKTYLVLNVPQELSLNNFNPDLRSDKGKTAYELLMKEFNKLNKKDEFKLLFNICDELNKNGSGLTQSQAIDWFKKLEKLLNEIHSEHTKEGQKERSKLRREYEDILVNRPFYIPAQKTNEAKRIAREILMNYPCSIIIDIAKFPSFLPSSKARKYEYGGEINGEVFLAPNIDPSKWSKGGIAKIPLHKCDFSDFEKNYAQVILIDIEKKREKGKRIYWKFKELCKYNGIKIFESLEVM